MRTTWREWQRRRRELLGRQIDAVSRYDALAAVESAHGGNAHSPKPLGGAVDRKPRDDEHWEMIRRACHAAAAARSVRWRWIGNRRVVIDLPEPGNVGDDH